MVGEQNSRDLKRRIGIKKKAFCCENGGPPKKWLFRHWNLPAFLVAWWESQMNECYQWLTLFLNRFSEGLISLQVYDENHMRKNAFLIILFFLTSLSWRRAVETMDFPAAFLVKDSDVGWNCSNFLSISVITIDMNWSNIIMNECLPTFFGISQFRIIIGFHSSSFCRHKISYRE